jgi:hypothetical protein
MEQLSLRGFWDNDGVAELEAPRPDLTVEGSAVYAIRERRSRPTR